ncbi:hypothetical protein N0V95_002404 [Ascochyta clinopodiicola]|nr:hypothetical protein N0V95_002404 [Ascochyta clinopodiicola]
MLAFIYLAYQMMALLYDTVPAFKDNWTECIGDLRRYKLAIEEEDLRDLDAWASCARTWYSKAADRDLSVGRRYRHLAILARPTTNRDLYYLSQSMKADESFPSARGLVVSLFDPLVKEEFFSASQKGIPTYEIPSIVESHGRKLNLNALGDTCATENFMSPACAAKLGLDIDKTRSRVVRVGSGARVRTTGIVSTTFQFRDEPETEYPLLFQILPNVVQDLVLGKAFLSLTRTFKSKANRLRRVKERFTKTLKQCHLLYLGDSGPRFTGFLNGRPAKALADTGSNVLVMDEAFATSLGLPILRAPQHRNRLVFADGSTKMTAGMTSNVEWRFGIADETAHYLNFHILENAPAPIILSDSFLFDTNAYDEYDCYLVDEDIDADYEDTHFFHIGYDDTYNAQGRLINT